MLTKFKTILFSILGITISILLVMFSDNVNTYYGAQGVYRIYLNGSSVGVIKKASDLENYIDKEQESIKEKYNVSKVYIPTGLEIKPELSYNENLEAAKSVYNKIKDEESFTIKGYTISVYEETEKEATKTNKDNKEDEKKETELKLKDTIYVLDKKIFEEAITSTIYAFIDEEKYQAYVNEEQVKIKDLEEGTIIENVYLKEKVTIKEDFVPADKQIFTDTKLLAKYLLYGTIENQKKYKVKSGDTIPDIAYNNKLNVREFLIANKNIASEKTLLYAGQEVIVDLISPIFTLIEETKETVYQEKNYKTEIIEDLNFYVGYSQVVQSGAKGEEFVTRNVRKENGKVTNAINISTIETKAPINRIVKTGNRAEYLIGNAGIWVWPTRSGCCLSTLFGYDSLTYSYTRYHEAIDITGTGCGSPIYAANDGTVTKVAYTSSYGNYIEINHNNGYITQYAHLANEGNVSVGQAVEMGKLIGVMGSTGESSGCHLHFVSIYNGRRFNPLQLYAFTPRYCLQ